MVCSPWGRKKLDTTKRLSLSGISDTGLDESGGSEDGKKLLDSGYI